MWHWTPVFCQTHDDLSQAHHHQGVKARNERSNSKWLSDRIRPSLQRPLTCQRQIQTEPNRRSRKHGQQTRLKTYFNAHRAPWTRHRYRLNSRSATWPTLCSLTMRCTSTKERDRPGTEKKSFSKESLATCFLDRRTTLWARQELERLHYSMP